MKRQEKKIDFSRIGESVGIFLAIQFCFLRFLKSTSFYFPFTQGLLWLTAAEVVPVGIWRLIEGLRKDFEEAGTENKKNVVSKCIFSILYLLVCTIITVKWKYAEFGYLPFITFCLYDVDIDRILKIFSFTITISLLGAICCALTGVIENYLYLNYAKGKLRGSYGICFPTDFAAYFIYLFVAFWSLQKKHAWWHSIIFALVTMGMTWIIRSYPHSDTSTICGIACLLIVIYDAVDWNVLLRFRGTKWISKTGDILIVAAFPLAACIFLYISWLYGQGNEWASGINTWMSGRIALTWQHYQKYGIHAFGALTPQVGAGHGLIRTEVYEFLDSTYALILIRYGWVMMGIITFLWVWMTHRALRAGHRRLALSMAVIALHSVSEHHFTELNYNILLAMPLCSLVTLPLAKTQSTEDGKKKNAFKVLIAGVIILAVAVLLICILPYALSWMRSLFSLAKLKGSGINSLPAFLFSVFIIALVIIEWVALIQLLRQWIHGKTPTMALKKSFLGIIVTELIVVFFVGLGIKAGIKNATDQLVVEKDAVEAILNVAQQPVYASDFEELYHRNYPGFQYHVFSDMELARDEKGTILLNHDEEGYQIIATGGKFTELSPYTGLFTYDQSVVDKLTAMGYTLTGYYSAERQVNLEDLKRANKLDLSEQGGLILCGKEHSLLVGPDIDQFGGSYRVNYKIKLESPVEDETDIEQPVCVLRVKTLWGQDTRAERVVYLKEFMENREMLLSIDYGTGNTRGVQYQVECEDGMEVSIESISWRKIPA